MSVDVEVLVREHKKSAWTDGGIVIHTVPSLIGQLREAVYGGMERGAGSASLQSRLPIDAAALDLYMLIDRQVTEVWVQAFKRVPDASRIEVLLSEWAAWAADDAIVTVNERDVYAKDAVWSWVDRIENFFDPPRNSQIKADCVACGVRLLPARDDGAPEFALRFVRDRTTGETLRAECASCGATWPPSNFEFLGKQIGIDVDRKKEEFFEREAKSEAKKVPHDAPERR